MREIKFRAWDKKNGYYADYEDIEEEITAQAIDGWRSEDGGTSFTLDYGIKDFELEQYTGLKDKNGKEIYEGDIVKNIEGINETAVCVWDESNAEFDFRCRDGKYTRDNVKSWLEMYEVIGNIHENPEMLGGKDE